MPDRSRWDYDYRNHTLSQPPDGMSEEQWRAFFHDELYVNVNLTPSFERARVFKQLLADHEPRRSERFRSFLQRLVGTLPTPIERKRHG